MTKVVLDESLRAKLNGLNEQLEVCDESGRTLGHFLPAELYRELVSAWTDALFPPEEVQRAREQTGGRTLAEIWKRLPLMPSTT